ncbi:hypothetical protein GQ53DRAFT_765936 [Thozetella sp. PMI_491]|nr:hypothetical protein GQ53DRAFT_765936 [Thozetella sp. PMI_491]
MSRDGGYREHRLMRDTNCPRGECTRGRYFTQTAAAEETGAGISELPSGIGPVRPKHKMGRKYDHNIRRHFVDVDKGDAVYNRARCNYCLKDIAATASTLQRHLNSCRPYKESAGSERAGPTPQKRRPTAARKSGGPIRTPVTPGGPVRKATTCEYGSTKYYENEENYWLKQHARLQIEAGNALERAIAARKKASTGDADLQRRMNDGRDQVNQAVSFGWNNQDYPLPAPMPNMGDQA